MKISYLAQEAIHTKCQVRYNALLHEKLVAQLSTQSKSMHVAGETPKSMQSLQPTNSQPTSTHPTPTVQSLDSGDTSCPPTARTDPYGRRHWWTRIARFRARPGHCCWLRWRPPLRPLPWSSPRGRCPWSAVPGGASARFAARRKRPHSRSATSAKLADPAGTCTDTRGTAHNRERQLKTKVLNFTKNQI